MELIKQWLVQKNQRNTVRKRKRDMWHTEKVSVLNELKNLATRGNLEVLSINLTLGIYKLAVYLWNSSNVGQENYDFFRHPRNNICSILILPTTQKCMPKISKEITTFIDHCRKGEILQLKKLKKPSVIKFIIRKEFWGSLKLKFRSLFLKIKNTGRKREFL